MREGQAKITVLVQSYVQNDCVIIGIDMPQDDCLGTGKP